MQTMVTGGNITDAVCLRLRELLQAQLDTNGPAMVRLEGVEERLLHIRPQLMALVLPADPEPILGVLRRVRSLIAGQILVVGPVADPRLILRVLQAGADHYLDQQDLDAGVDAVLRRLAVPEDTATGNGRLLAVLACTGGCGATTLAVNLAVLLARQQGKALLLDLKPGSGDPAALLNLKPTHTLADLCTQAQRMDQSVFDRCLARHGSGVHLLAAPKRHHDIKLVKAPALGRILNHARSTFPFIVTDLQDCYHEEQMLVLRQAERVLLTIRLDFTALRRARQVLHQLEELGVSRQRVEVVVNRHGQANELPCGQAEEALGMKIVHAIPDDPRIVNHCNNIGEPVVAEAAQAKISKALAQLANAFLPAADNRPAAPAPVLRPAGEPLGFSARLHQLFGYAARSSHS